MTATIISTGKVSKAGGRFVITVPITVCREKNLREKDIVNWVIIEEDKKTGRIYIEFQRRDKVLEAIQSESQG